MGTSRKRFFASYSRKDRHLVEPVVRVLRSTSTPVFCDIDTIEPGEKWSERLQTALAEATTLVLFWSRNSVKSEWVSKEWQAAIQGGKVVIPVLLDSTPLTPPLSDYQYIDFRDLVARLSSSRAVFWRSVSFAVCLGVTLFSIFSAVLFFHDSLPSWAPWSISSITAVLFLHFLATKTSSKYLCFPRFDAIYDAMANRLIGRLIEARP